MMHLIIEVLDDAKHLGWMRLANDPDEGVLVDMAYDGEAACDVQRDVPGARCRRVPKHAGQHVFCTDELIDKTGVRILT
jgi:hypothetical protein